MKFTYESYAGMLKCLKNAKYQFTDYSIWKNTEKTVILRHDVDYSLQKAVVMSEIEKELCVHATYFILLSTNFYNIYSLSSRKCIERIMENGGKIGLHFDEMQYNIKTGEELKEYVQREAELLSEITGRKVDVVSMHRPSEKFLAGNIEFENLTNSYSKTYFKEMKYLSDSRRHWREDIDGIIRQGAYKRLHILVHPFWYFAGAEKDLKQTLREAVLHASLEYYDNFGENFKNLADEMERGEIERWMA